jgi:hypothetical protein
MVSLQEQIKIDKLLMKGLKTSETRHLICSTDKGPLHMVIHPLDADYEFHLDATPVDKAMQKDLLALFDGILYEL